MKNRYILNILAISGLLTACSTEKPVEIVKGKDYSTVVQQTAMKHQEIPANLPNNVTAICRDGSYSTATENVCVGNGGITTVVRRYHAE